MCVSIVDLKQENEKVMEVPNIDGFVTEVIEASNDAVSFHIDIKSIEQCEEWKTKYSELTSSSFNVCHTNPGSIRIAFHQKLQCFHGIKRPTASKHHKTRTG